MDHSSTSTTMVVVNLLELDVDLMVKGLLSMTNLENVIKTQC